MIYYNERQNIINKGVDRLGVQYNANKQQIADVLLYEEDRL